MVLDQGQSLCQLGGVFSQALHLRFPVSQVFHLLGVFNDVWDLRRARILMEHLIEPALKGFREGFEALFVEFFESRADVGLRRPASFEESGDIFDLLRPRLLRFFCLGPGLRFLPLSLGLVNLFLSQVFQSLEIILGLDALGRLIEVLQDIISQKPHLPVLLHERLSLALKISRTL